MGVEGIGPYAEKVIRIRARQLVGKAGFSESDCDDLAQDMKIDLWRRLSKFDPSKAPRSKDPLKDFTDRVVRNKVASILEGRKAQRRDCRRHCSLNDTLQNDGGIHHREPGRVVLFSWADGMRGKPGYVYQADNWLYGGFIRTEFYVTAENEVVHPRQVITRCGRRDRAFTRSMGLRRVRGRQFRYCHFLCGHGLMKRLLRESPFRWGQGYPKKDDCVWTFEGAAEGSRESREPPRFQGSGQFRHAAPLFAQAEAEETPERAALGLMGKIS